MAHIGTKVRWLAPMVLLLCLEQGAALAQDSAIKPTGDPDRFWAAQRKVRVIQKRTIRKDGRHEFTPYVGVVPNDDFFIYFPTGLRYNWFFREDWSLEVFGAYCASMKTNLEGYVSSQERVSIETNLPQKLQWYAGLAAAWNLFHGKVGAMDADLLQFDLNLSLGYNLVGTEIRESPKDDYKPKVDFFAFNIGAGVRMFILDWLAFRLDWRTFLYQAEGGGVSYPMELTLGVSFLTAAPK